MRITGSVNDINKCLDQAHVLVNQLGYSDCKEHSLAQIFKSLAGVEKTGLLAFAIWRERSRLLSSLRTTAQIRYDALTRVRHART